jgi:sugar phosphate isomerase/epimerase
MKSIVLCSENAPEDSLKYYQKYGFGIEIQKFLDITDNTDEMTAPYNTVLPHDMPKYMHAPFYDLCLGSNNSKIAAVTREFFDFAYTVADKLGCEGIIVHHGYVPNTSMPSGWIVRAEKFWDDFFKSHPHNIMVFMENHLEHTPDIMAEVCDRCEDKRLSINLDIGHAHAFSKTSVIDWIKQLKHRIGYVHLHQNNGQKDEHLGLREGSMNMVEILHALEEYSPNAVWAIECSFADMDDSISFLSAHGFLQFTHNGQCAIRGGHTI